MIKERSKIKRKIIGGLKKVLNSLENDNNPDFFSNGEAKSLKEVARIMSNSQIKDLVLMDIGANKGEYTDLLLSEFSKHKAVFDIHIFEPTSSCFSLLRSKFDNNNNISLNKNAVSDLDGEIEIFFDKERSGLASLHKRDLSSYGVSLSISESISAIRMDNYILKNKIPHIHYAKIDIEGHEFSALQGFGEYLNSEFVDIIQFEYGGANIDSRVFLKDIYDLLQTKGFALFKIGKRHWHPFNYHPKNENFMLSNYIALGNIKKNM